jgi:hypothetical protein
MSSLSRSPQAVRTSITTRLNNYAKANKQGLNLVRRRFVMARSWRVSSTWTPMDGSSKAESA